jgi:hypothetical protein
LRQSLCGLAVVVDAICGSLSMRKLDLKVWRVMWRVEAWSLVEDVNAGPFVRLEGRKERRGAARAVDSMACSRRDRILISKDSTPPNSCTRLLGSDALEVAE